MDELFAWMTDNAWAAWLGAALILLGIEAMSADFVFLMLAGAALAAAVVATVFGLPAQVIVAAITAVALLMLVRPIIKQRMISSAPGHSSTEQSLTGRQAVVVSEEVTETSGLAKIDGEVWSARYPENSGALPAAPGSRVEVIGIDGATLRVTPVIAVQDEPHPASGGDLDDLGRR